MSEEARIHAIALFYFYSLVDEVAAKQATLKTITACYKHVQDKDEELVNWPSIIVLTTSEYCQKAKKLRAKSQGTLTYESGWLIPEKVDLGPWKQFQKEGADEEFLAIIWSKVLGFSDQNISQGLGVTVGTVRHRLSRGLRHLGSLQSGGLLYG